MNNLVSYCGLVDARISASEKDLPVAPILFLGSWNLNREILNLKMIYHCLKNNDKLVSKNALNWA